MTAYDLAIAPFADFAFMRRALAGSLVLSCSACPVGVFLTLRRMSLAGDAIAHAILPGVAVGFLLFGLQILPMTIGGFAAGIAVALLAGLVARATVQREDSSLAAFYLISLALGVTLVSLKGSSVDLLHVLFGAVLGLDDPALILIASMSGLSLVVLALGFRALAAECLDPLFLRSVGRSGPVVHVTFIVTVVLNLVAGFQALGTLLSVGLMMLPAAAARFWTRRLVPMCLVSVAFGILASVAGLLASFHLGLASGPAIVLAAGLIYGGSVVVAPRGLFAGRTRIRHRTA